MSGNDQLARYGIVVLSLCSLAAAFIAWKHDERIKPLEARPLCPCSPVPVSSPSPEPQELPTRSGNRAK